MQSVEGLYTATRAKASMSKRAGKTIDTDGSTFFLESLVILSETEIIICRAGTRVAYRRNIKIQCFRVNIIRDTRFLVMMQGLTSQLCWNCRRSIYSLTICIIYIFSFFLKVCNTWPKWKIDKSNVSLFTISYSFLADIGVINCSSTMMTDSAHFTRGEHTLKVPMSLFRNNRERLILSLKKRKDLPLQDEDFFIVLEGGVEVPFNDTDVNLSFRQVCICYRSVFVLSW